MYKCVCGKEFTNIYALNGHKSGCRINLGDDKYFEYIRKRKDANKVGWSKGLTKYTDDRIKRMSESVKNYAHTHKGYGKASTPEKELSRRKKLSEIAKHNKLGGYNPGSGKGKQGWYKGYWCDSSWELAFVIYNIEHNIPFKRNTDRFEYTYKGKSYKYIPDFILNNIYIEIKGYERVQDTYKYRCCTNLKVLREKEIKPYLEYTISKYGSNFTYLYEK